MHDFEKNNRFNCFLKNKNGWIKIDHEVNKMGFFLLFFFIVSSTFCNKIAFRICQTLFSVPLFWTFYFLVQLYLIHTSLREDNVVRKQRRTYKVFSLSHFDDKKSWS